MSLSDDCAALFGHVKATVEKNSENKWEIVAIEFGGAKDSKE